MTLQLKLLGSIAVALAPTPTEHGVIVDCGGAKVELAVASASAFRVSVAFDGARPAWAQWAEPVVQIESPGALAASERPDVPRVHSVYVESADDWIVRRARRASAPERTFVVTRDKQVEGRARSAGCQVWSPWAFLSECPDPDAKRGAGYSPNASS